MSASNSVEWTSNLWTTTRVGSDSFRTARGILLSCVNEILKELTGRFRKATSGNFLPKVSFVRTSFHLGDDSEQVSEWAAARTLLMAIAEYPRTALKSRAYFLRGLKVAEKDL